MRILFGCNTCPECLARQAKGDTSAVHEPHEIDLSKGNLTNDEIKELLKELESSLPNMKFVLVKDQFDLLFEHLEEVILKAIQEDDPKLKIKFSSFIKSHTKHNFTDVSKIFRSKMDITLAKFIKKHKIIKVKALLQDGKMNFSDIADAMKYTNIAHLSSQFKAVTGETLSQFCKANNCMFKGKDYIKKK